ncbi:MAG: hypothetical protein ACR2LV_03155 [Solirubrobacteraceae bacterium]
MLRVRVAFLVTLAFALAALLVPALAAAAPGDPDQSFGSGGLTSLTDGTELDAVAVESDGEIVATGASGSSLLLARFTAAGSLEGMSTGGPGVGRAIAIQPDGKIVVAGNDSATMVVERFNPDGRLDPRFGGHDGARVVTDGRANAVAIAPDGTVVAAGQFKASDTFQRAAIVRLKADGSLDTSFGAGGVSVVDLGRDSIAKGVAVQADNRVVFAGSVGPGASQVTNAFVVRLTAEGTLDPTFAARSIPSGGIVTGHPRGVFFYFHPRGGGASTFNSVALDPAGGIVAAGGDAQANPAALFLRLTCAGLPAQGFGGTSGTVTLPSGVSTGIGEPLGATGVAVTATGQIEGAGRFQDSGTPSIALWGVNRNGSQAFSTQQDEGSEARALALDASGNLVIAGDVLQVGSDQAQSGFVARYAGLGPSAPAHDACATAPPPPPPPPHPGQPTVTLGAISVSTGTTYRVSGSVVPNGQTTSYQFQYGHTSAYGLSTPVTEIGSGSAPVPATASLSTLPPGTIYHYRLIASNSAGTAESPDAIFTVPPKPPPSAPPQRARLALFGHTAFASPRRVVGVFVGCFAAKQCVGQATITNEHQTIGTRHRYVIAGETVGVVHIALTRAGAKALSRARGRLGVHLAFEVHGGPTVEANATVLAAFGTGPGQRGGRSNSFARIFGHSGFMLPSGFVGVLVSCDGAQHACAGRVTITGSGRSGRDLGRASYLVQPGDIGVVHLTLTAAARTSLRAARRLAVNVTLLPLGGRSAAARVTLYPLAA